MVVKGRKRAKWPVRPRKSRADQSRAADPRPSPPLTSYADAASALDLDMARGSTARDILTSIAQDTEANAMSRANAARALAEMDGMLGRHALPPVRDTQDVATLNRAELVRELERLRAVCGTSPPSINA